eukprot:7377962-Prymnesium_polylepis.1
MRAVALAARARVALERPLAADGMLLKLASAARQQRRHQRLLGLAHGRVALDAQLGGCELLCSSLRDGHGSSRCGVRLCCHRRGTSCRLRARRVCLPDLRVRPSRSRLARRSRGCRLCSGGRRRLRRAVMQWARAALAAVRGRVSRMPAGARLVEPRQAERDLRALLAIALAHLALLHTSTPGFRQLPPPHHRPGHQILLVHDLDRSAQPADGGAARAHVVELLPRRWVDAQEDSDL